MCQLYNKYLVTLNEYNKILKMRNEYIRKHYSNIDYNYLDILEFSGGVHYDWKHRKGDC